MFKRFLIIWISLFFINCQSPGLIENSNLSNSENTLNVNYDFLAYGCHQVDCIPPVDNPEFQDAHLANWLNADDIVIGFQINNQYQAYPLKILKWHQIVNQQTDDQNIIVTYCVLSGTAAVYYGQNNGTKTSFGNSGMLYNSNFIMYDREKGHFWQQFSGKKLSRDTTQTEQFLEKIPITIVSWETWKKMHPESKILSLDTGFSRNYDSEPYPGYQENNDILFKIEESDKSIPPKSVVYGIEINNKFKAYPESAFQEKNIIFDKFQEIPIQGQKSPNGLIEFHNQNTQQPIPHTKTYWFTWTNFTKNTELWAN